MSFSETGLHTSLVKQCEFLNFNEPTPIQKQAIPVILSGGDLIGCAATGTGKTAAFLLPILQKILSTPAMGKSVRALIIAPTRELVSQIATNLQSLDKGNRTRAVTVVGGASTRRQMIELRRGSAVVIATPGRLMDHLENRVIDLSAVEVLVLDEADRMLDMGFWPVIRQVIARLPKQRQTLLFSATMSPAIEEIARLNMCQPQIIEVNPRGKAAATVTQTAYSVAHTSKMDLLLYLLKRERCSRVLIFTRTRRGAERLSRALTALDHPVNRIHADRSQAQRELALSGFKTGRYRVLVATDIAARGLDVREVSHVINFDVPDAPEDYVHRIGRTGRAGSTGQAITLVSPVEEISLRSIERLTGQSIKRVLLPEFGGFAISPSSTKTTPSGGSSLVRSFAPRRGRR